jgi:hypothetical protein
MPINRPNIYGTFFKVNSVPNIQGPWYKSIGQLRNVGGSGPVATGVTLESFETTTLAVGVTLGGTPVTVTLPSGIAVGDMIFLVCSADNDQGLAMMTPPSGFTQVTYFGSVDYDVHLMTCFKIADGTEGATVDVLFTNTVFNDAAIFALHITGNSVSTAPVVADVAKGQFGTQALWSTKNSTAADSLFLAIAAYDGADGDPWTISFGGPPSGTWPATLTGYAEFNDGTAGVSVGFATQAVATLGDATGDLIFDAVVSDGWSQTLIEIV